MSRKWKGFKRLVSVKRALEAFFNAIEPKVMEAESVDLENALGRVLAEDVVAKRDIPPFDRAAMDGYALRAEDTYGASKHSPIVLKVIGEVVAGQESEFEVGAGEAVRIHAGAQLPKGADAVVEVESTKEMGGKVLIYESVPPFRNVSRKGEDVRAGELLLGEGTPIGPFELALLASLNQKKVLVRRKPVVSMISTGSELVEVGDPRAPLRTINSNRWLVKGIVEEHGGEFSYEGIVEDDVQKLTDAIKGCNGADVILTCGGTSVGTSDLVPDALERLKADVVVHGVAIMPGKPTLLAVLPDRRPFIGLPGYPVSTAVSCLLFLVPLMERLLGIKGEPVTCRMRARLRRKVPSKPGTLHFVRVKLERDEEGWLATPIRVSGAGILSSLVRADAFLMVPEELEGYEEGEEVEVIPFKRYLQSLKVI